MEETDCELAAPFATSSPGSSRVPELKARRPWGRGYPICSRFHFSVKIEKHVQCNFHRSQVVKPEKFATAKQSTSKLIVVTYTVERV